ncbi:MAG: hypothetical protein GX594_10190 [Pirellulaceae bacterium]|nr:hypothetical protein [Pirellulaceae bacterium]
MIRSQQQNPLEWNNFHVQWPPPAPTDEDAASAEPEVREAAPMPPLEISNEDLEWRILL